MYLLQKFKRCAPLYNHPEYMTDYARMAERFARNRKIKKILFKVFVVACFVLGVAAW